MIDSKHFSRSTRKIIKRALDTPKLSDMLDDQQLYELLRHLANVILDKLPGDVVEMGCCWGVAAVYEQTLLNEMCPDKELYLYDSFEGLPEKLPQDDNEVAIKFGEGMMATTIEKLNSNFKSVGLDKPKHVAKGWFDEIPDEKYPEQICYAFFDCDFYTSMKDCFKIIYPKLVKGARVLVHDYNWEVLPGVKIACDESLADKPEEIIDLGCRMGLMIKK